MTWNELKNYIWKPLSNLPENVAPVTADIYQSGAAYLMTAPYFKDISPSEEPVITLVIWAPSVGALKRAFDFGLEEDDGVVGEPPQEMLLAPNANTWVTIREAGNNQGIKFLESASYRIMTDGAFIHRELESRNYRAYFRSRHNKPNERPYAIAVGA